MDSIQIYTQLADYLGVSVGVAIFLIILVSIWSFIWKGFALWKSVKKNHLVWFIILLVVNTVGILEILYIFVFSKLSLRKSKTVVSKAKPAKKTAKKKR